MTNLEHYWKTIIALIPVVVFVGNAVVQAVTTSGGVTMLTIFPIVVSGVAAYGVFQKANAPKVSV